MVTRVPEPDEGNQDDSTSPLDRLAIEAANGPQPDGPSPAEKAQDAQADAAAAAAFEQLAGGIEAMILGALRAVRTRVARTLPEIVDEWKDDVLQAPAKAAVPVVNKYAARLLPLLGEFPEEAALCMALVPMAMGYMNALGAHAAKIVDQPKP